MSSNSTAHLPEVVASIESLIADRQAINDDIKTVLAEAKASGLDPKAIRAVIRLRAMDPDDRAEQQALVETYMAALGG